MEQTFFSPQLFPVTRQQEKKFYRMVLEKKSRVYLRRKYEVIVLLIP
ncbi:hypothetical protein NLD30_10475 [SCandidatus Aminicenantes bacterium Aminicenantia_JdfR_composite]|jgi:hypothetical protein|nr:hypothetical protein [SCandidatus Aminicenantes bacterium Aminicenantia_JdfR_composite]